MMLISEPFITPQFCETMYEHYADRLLDPALPKEFKVYITQAQDVYTEMHALLVPFEEIVRSLPIYHR